MPLAVVTLRLLRIWLPTISSITTPHRKNQNRLVARKIGLIAGKRITPI